MTARFTSRSLQKSLRPASATSGLFCLLLGCGPAPSSAFEDPLRYLSFERDRAEEARSIHARFEARGHDAVTIEGERFHAIGARGDNESAVRVVTSRGIAFALDAPSERHTADAVTLLSANRDHDVDLDGNEEVAIALESADRRCLVFVRVHENGAVQDVPLDLQDHHATPCIVALEDVAGDARKEAIVALQFFGFPSARVNVPFTLGAIWRIDTSHAAFFEGERARRERAIDSAEELQHAIELALIARLEGAPYDAQLAAFDRRVSSSSFAISPAALREARAVIELQREVTARPEETSEAEANEARTVEQPSESLSPTPPQTQP